MSVDDWKLRRDWDTICGSCGDRFLSIDGTPKTFTVGNATNAYRMEITVIWCPMCADEIPCQLNERGIHGEVYVLSELEDKGIIVNYTLDPWCDIPRHQVGYCSVCMVVMWWNVEKQHWTTVVEPLDSNEEPDIDPIYERPFRRPPLA